MLVSERMTANPLTVAPAATAQQALDVMTRQGLQHLPVVDEEGALVGIVSERDLLRAGSSPAPVAQARAAQVSDAMAREVTSVTEYTALEEAAQIMADGKIGVLPVLRHGRLVGILTPADLLGIFLELLGAREPGLRLTMLIPEEKGMLASLTGEIASMGGNILALSTFMGEDPTNRLVTVKVAGVSKVKLVAVMEALGMEIVDVREV